MKAKSLSKTNLAKNDVMEKLQNSKCFLQPLLASLPFPVSVVDAKSGEILLANDSGYGEKQRRCHEQFCCDTCQEHRDLYCPVKKVLSEKAPVKLEYFHLDQHGKKKCSEIRAYPIFDDTGKVISVIRHVCDLTEQKNTEKAMRESLEKLTRSEERYRTLAESKEVLLQEVNHRVKNNLSAIISLIHKEQDRCLLGKFSNKQALGDLEKRIQGLLTVHRMLSAAQWRPLVLTDLCEQMIQAGLQSSLSGNSIDLCISPASVTVSNDQAHHLAMVINELLTNTIKHAMTEEIKTTICLRVDEEENRIAIHYSDNGHGYPQALIARNFTDTGLGMDIIRGIVKKNLNGEIQFENNGGAVIHIIFGKNPGGEQI